MKTTENPEIPGEQIEDLTDEEPSIATMIAVAEYAETADVMAWDGRGDGDYDSQAAADSEGPLD